MGKELILGDGTSPAELAALLYAALKEDDPGAHMGVPDHEFGTVIDGRFNLVAVASALLKAARMPRPLPVG